MKKLLYSFAAVATMLFAAGCAQEKLVGPAGGDTVEATFSVALPDAVATKAISDGTAATELLFFAFDGNGKYLANVKPAEAVTVSNYEASVTVKLIKGMTYNFVFWAQTPGKYTNLISVTDGTAGASLDISSVAASMMNDDSFDAFYGRIANYKVEKAFSTEQLILTRPFAQVNVGAYAEDIAAAQASNIDTDAIKTKYFVGTEGKLSVNTTLDLLTGVAGGASEVDLALAARPAETLTVDGVGYTWLATVYLLQTAPDYYGSDLAFVDANETKATLAELDFNISTTQNGDAVTTDRNVYNVPVQRNYRTNILGNIFSVEGTFNILVDQNFGGEDYLPEYENIAALNAAFAKTGATDADKWSYKVKVLAAGDTKEIKLPVTTDPVDIVFADDAFETEQISIVYGDTADGAAKPANLTLYTGKLAKLTATVPATHVDLVNGSDITDAEVATSNTTFVVKAGAHVKNLKINAGGLIIEAAAEGSALEDGEVENITVDVNADVTIPENYDGTVEYFGDIESQAALEKALAGGGEFTVMADIDTDAQFVVPAGKTVVLDMNGKTISNTKDIWAGNSWSLISVQGGELTIKGDGKFLAKEDDEYAADVRKGGKLVIENGEFAGNVTCIYAYKGTVEINGGTFYIQQLAPNVSTDKYRYTLNCLDASWQSGVSSFTVTGGTFKEFDPSAHQAEPNSPNSFVPTGYMTTVTVDDENGATWYTVEEGAVELTGIEITTAPTKTNYYVGDTFVADGLVVTAKYNNNTSEPVTDYTTDAAEVLSAAGEDKDVTVTYQEKTATFKVNVTAVALESIAVTTLPTKTTYTVGEEIDLTGIRITATNNNGSTFEVTEGYTTDAEAVLATAGANKDVTVTYQEKTATFTVTVNEAPKTIAELKALMDEGDNGAISASVTLGPVKVTNVTSTKKNAYIEDNTGGMVIYDKNGGIALSAGNAYTGLAVSSTTMYNTYDYEITAYSADNATSEALSELPLTILEASNFNAEDYKVYQYMRVGLNGLTLDSAVSSTNSASRTHTIGGVQVYFPSMDIKTESVVNVVGRMSIYNGVYQISVSSAEDVTIVTEGIETTTITGLVNKSIKQGESLDFSTIVSNNVDTIISYSLENAAPGITLEGSTVSVADDAEVDATATIVAKIERVDGSHTAATASATITVAEATQGDPETHSWVLVTDASSLAVGDVIIITNSDADKSISTTQSNNNRPAVECDLDNLADTVQQIKLEAGTKDGTFAFNVGTGYLYAASSTNNYMRTQEENDDNGSWEISISSEVATITAQGTNTRKILKYNSSNKLFACYASGQQDVKIYRYE